MLVKKKGELELGAHAISGGHEHRLVDHRHGRLEKTAEATDIVDNALGIGRCDQGFDPGHERIPRLDINPGILVGLVSLGHVQLLVSSPLTSYPAQNSLLWRPRCINSRLDQVKQKTGDWQGWSLA